jgi:hypothetical protein
MTEPEQKLTPATPNDLADTLSFALRFEGRKSQHDSDKLNADIVAKRLVRYLDKAGYVVMKKPPLGGHDQVARAARPRRGEVPARRLSKGVSDFCSGILRPWPDAALWKALDRPLTPRLAWPDVDAKGRLS